MKRKNVRISDKEYSDSGSSSESETEPKEKEIIYNSDKEIDYKSDIVVVFPALKQPFPVHKKRKLSAIDKKRQKTLDEINKLDKKTNILEQILDSNLDINKKAHLVNELHNVSTDKEKIKTYVKRVLNLPEKEVNIDDNADVILNLRKNLDECVYGHTQTKEEIIDFISGKLSNPAGYRSQVLALNGPPGVGKTRFIRALGKTLNIPFSQISFGGLNDVSVLTGHDYTYIGSKPGKIYDCMVRSKCTNPIIYLDEIDKISSPDSDKFIAINGILTHLLDPEQNMEFRDNYLGDVHIDLSKVFFIISFNNESNIDPVVLNRMKVITIKDTTVKDKIEITKKFSIPEIYSTIGINSDNIVLDDNNIKYIITSKTKEEKGMRNINKNFFTLFSKINTLMKIDTFDLDIQRAIVTGLSYETINLSEHKKDGKIIVSKKLIDLILTEAKEIPTYMHMYC